MEKKTANSQLVKTVNTSIVLDIVRKRRQISRAEIAKITKLNPSTVSNITAELIKLGILKEVGVGTSRKGRRPIQLSLNPDGPFVIGVEVTGDRIVALVMNTEAKIVAKVRTDINFNKVENLIIDKVIETIHEVIKKSGKSKNKIKAIGMGITGLIDSKTGIAKFSPNINWKDVPIKKIIEKEFEIQTFVDNDVKAMALGEYRFGSGKERQNLVCINIGEGLGSGIIINGKIYRGTHHIAGEIGHTIVDLNGDQCRCGNQGCLETFVSGRAIVSRAIMAIKQKKETLITKLLNNEIGKITPKIVFEAAAKGDKLAKDIILEASKYLGIAIANVINSLDPEVVILGGEIVQFNNFYLMLEPAKKVATEYTFGGETRKTKILTTQLKDDCSAIGAATLALEKLFNPLNL